MLTPELTRSDFEVLNVIVLKKMCRETTVAEVLGIAAAAAKQSLADLERGGLIGRADDLLLPTEAAEPALVALAARVYKDLRADPRSDDLHGRFEKINTQLLQSMAAWQQIDRGGQKVANDHTDPDYDEKIISRAAKLVERLKTISSALSEYDPRFRLYDARFDSAVARVDQGKTEYLSSPTVESVHNVWFEFHEDLLRTLGKERKD